MGNSAALLRSLDNGILELCLNQPPLNPIGVAQVEQLTEVLPDIENDKSIRCVVIRGKGEHFSVGANLKEGEIAQQRGPREFVAERIELFNAIANLSKPVIAAIEGYCLGGGLELAMSCHLRVASTNAILALPEVDLGAAPMWSGASRVLRLVGRSYALELLLRGNKIPAVEAHRIGLVNAIYEAEEFETAVDALATELAAKPPLAVAAILRVINHSMDTPLAEALDYELDQFSALAGTKDNIEGVMAMFEKRKPVFSGE